MKILITTALVVALVVTAGCSIIGPVADQVSNMITQRQERQQSGFDWEGWVTCDQAPTYHMETTERWCHRRIAPTVAACVAGQGFDFYFGDTLSGISRQVLYDLCARSEIGQRWPNLQGTMDDGKLVVNDANRGSKPL